MLARALLAVAVLLVPGACTSPGEGDGGPPPADAPAGPSHGRVDPDAQGPAVVDGAVEGGTVTVHLPGDPGPATLDPTAAWTVSGGAIQQALVSRSLTQYRREDDGTMVLVPDLATGVGRPNADYTEWRFTIREGARWEDGQPITPEEVAFGIERSLDAATFPRGPGVEYSRAYFAGARRYGGPYSEPAVDYDGVRVEGRDVVISMSRPFPDMPYWGAYKTMGPVPRGRLSDPPGYGRRTVLASGPYKVQSFTPGEELVLARNEHWDPATDPARTQYPDRWVFRFDQDVESVDAMFVDGTSASETAIATAVGDVVRVEEQVGDRLVRQPAPCASFLYPDYEATTPVVRRAIAHGFDHQDVWLAAGEVPGETRVPASTLLPPGLLGRRDYLVGDAPIGFRPERARELLARAGHAPGEFELRVVMDRTDPVAVATTTELVEGLTEAGFDVTTVPVDEPAYEVWLDPEHPVNRGADRGAGLRAVGWCADWPSGLTMIPPLVRSGATYNLGGFDEPRVDGLMNDVVNRPLAEQPAAWGRLDERIQTDYFPLVPVAFHQELFVHGDRIGGFAGDGVLGAPDYKGIHVVS